MLDSRYIPGQGGSYPGPAGPLAGPAGAGAVAVAGATLPVAIAAPVDTADVDHNPEHANLAQAEKGLRQI